MRKKSNDSRYTDKADLYDFMKCFFWIYAVLPTACQVWKIHVLCLVVCDYFKIQTTKFLLYLSSGYGTHIPARELLLQDTIFASTMLLPSHHTWNKIGENKTRILSSSSRVCTIVWLHYLCYIISGGVLYFLVWTNKLNHRTASLRTQTK